jgi:hypothetical protein
VRGCDIAASAVARFSCQDQPQSPVLLGFDSSPWPRSHSGTRTPVRPFRRRTAPLASRAYPLEFESAREGKDARHTLRDSPQRRLSSGMSCQGRETRIRKSAVSGRCKQAEGIPPIAPCVPNPRVRIQNQKPAAEFREVITRNEPGLSSSDHDRVQLFGVAPGMHLMSPFCGLVMTPRKQNRATRRTYASGELTIFLQAAGMGNFM